jgi:fucokinase
MIAMWDYLILTACNETQRAGYARQLKRRRELGHVQGVRETLVVADPDGQRVGSGGSTVYCLLTVLNREIAARKHASGKESAAALLAPQGPAAAQSWADVFRGLRILVIHAGGDSRRLPAYGPCGKIFTPVPVPGDGALENTLFDIQWPIYRRLPAPADGTGHVVVCSGDVFLDFDPAQIDLAAAGITGLGCKASPEQASRHGVYCLGSAGQVRRFLQKPSPAYQRQAGAVDGFDLSVLDIGVVQFDAAVATSLLQLCGTRPDGNGALAWSGPVVESILRHGLDFYREILCALGSDCTLESYREAIRSSGSDWDDASTASMYETLSKVPFWAQVVKECTFLHFGTTREIIHSGQVLQHRNHRASSARRCVMINSLLADGVRLPSNNAWVEGCVVRGPVELEGENVLAGVDVGEPLRLSHGACLDVVPGRSRSGEPMHFIRCYHESDLFQGTSSDGTTLSGYPIVAWMEDSGARPEEIWDGSIPAEERNAWNARLFPAEKDADGHRRWLWMHAPARAKAKDFVAWREADRYSLQEITGLVDDDRFHGRRLQIRETVLLGSLRRCFVAESGFSAADLGHLLSETRQPEKWIAGLVAEAHWHWLRRGIEAADEVFIFPRIAHTLGTALQQWAQRASSSANEILSRLPKSLAPADAEWLAAAGLEPFSGAGVEDWAARLKTAAFSDLRSRIVSSGSTSPELRQSALRSDEIVWGRAPARLDLAGGWTDTPPYALECGGRVLNAAVELNDQPPIHVYARVVPELVVRCRSIDRGTHEEIPAWEHLLDFAETPTEFSLPKAALVISGFAPPAGSAAGPALSLPETLRRFGGGLELTTLAAIPKGSGLGTSSIMGAVLLATIHRVFGVRLSPRELFHGVLRLEQVMTTGGGWQDQIGGVAGGLKLVTTQPGLVPDPVIRYVPSDALDPQRSGGQTLLYYTGITRLAKNILHDVVGRWLDRDREAVETLREIGLLAGDMTEAVARKDLPEFGRLIDVAWQLNNRLDPNSTTEEIEALLDSVRPHLHGAKLLGAGGGGFLFMVAKSPSDACRVRELLDSHPPNPRGRFFDFSLSDRGLTVSVC